MVKHPGDHKRGATGCGKNRRGGEGVVAAIEAENIANATDTKNELAKRRCAVDLAGAANLQFKSLEK